tara:strand:- start:339 stop:1217 length:879 start_codon:yes stop_codon:yes gene_type:complete
MKFLVIGASGFVGRHIFNYLKASGNQVIGTQSSARQLGLVNFDLHQQRIKDLVAPAFIGKDQDIYAILCVKHGLMDRYAEQHSISYEMEVEKMQVLIDDLISLKIKPVYLTTSYVFDGNDGDYAEDSSHCPISEYGRQKAEMEKFVTRSKHDILALRLDKIVGDNPVEDHLFSEWNELVAQKKPILCIKDQIFSPTHVEDIARGVIKACTGRLSGLFNLVNPEPWLRSDLAKEFVAQKGSQIEVISKDQADFNFGDARPLKTYLNPSAFIEMTGMQFISMKEVISAFVSKTV